MTQKIRIKLRSYDHQLIDKSAQRILKAVKGAGAIVTGPTPLPTKRKIYTVLKSPHVHKKSREQFQQLEHKRLMDIFTSDSKVVEALMKLGISPGVDILIKA